MAPHFFRVNAVANMTLSPKRAKELIRIVMGTREREINCDECLADISEFVEARLTAQPLGGALEMVRDHLETCSSCREEYTLLRQAIEALDEQG